MICVGICVVVGVGVVVVVGVGVGVGVCSWGVFLLFGVSTCLDVALMMEIDPLKWYRMMKLICL